MQPHNNTPYPWNPNGPLCPALRQQRIWRLLLEYEVFSRVVKNMLVRAGLKNFSNIKNIEVILKSLLPVLDKPTARINLDRELAKKGCVNLANYIFPVAYHLDPSLKQGWSLDYLWNKHDRKLASIEVSCLKEWLAKKSYDPSQIDLIAIICCAFAMVSPKDSPEILSTLLASDPNFFQLLTSPEPQTVSLLESPTSISPPEPKSKLQEPAAKSKSIDPEPLSFVLSVPSDDIPQVNLDVIDILDQDELQKGQEHLQAFIGTFSSLHSLIGKLSSSVNNASIIDQATLLGLQKEFFKAFSETLKSGRSANAWLALLLERLNADDVTRHTNSEPALETLRLHIAQPHDSLDLLRNVCEESIPQLSSLINGISKRDAEMADALIEIQGISELTVRPDLSISYPLPSRHLVKGLDLKSEVELQLAESRAIKSNFIVEHKKALIDELNTLTKQFSISTLSTKLQEEFQITRGSIEQCSDIASLAQARQGCKSLGAKLASMPQARNLGLLAEEAISTLPCAEGVLTVAQGLHTRGQHLESLAVLTCLQLVLEVESSGFSDFSPFLNLLFSSAAELPNLGSESPLWVDAIFQQPWVRSLVHDDIRDNQT